MSGDWGAFDGAGLDPMDADVEDGVGLEVEVFLRGCLRFGSGMAAAG